MGITGKRNQSDFSALPERIRQLETRIEELAGRMAALEVNQGFHRAPLKDEADSLLAISPGEGLGEWLSKGALLQKMATVCFILVFALLLRTVTDYGYINATAGLIMGLLYVSVLATIGCVFYITGRQLANVFSISGFILLFSIVYEGYGRYGTMPIGIAYGILFIALVTSAAVAIKYQEGKLLTVSLVGVSISSLVLGFPRLNFPMSGGLLFTANWLAIIVSERHGRQKLKWPVTLLTLLFWALWAFKVYMPLRRGDMVPPFAHIEWLIPILFCFVVLYFMTYLRRYFSKADLTAYDAVIPSLNMLMLFLAGGVVIRNYWQHGWLLGLLAMSLALAHFAVGWRLSLKDSGRCAGVGGAFVAGALMLALGLPMLVGNLAWAVTCWSLVAYGLSRLSGHCNSGVIRAVSYLYQIFAVWVAIVAGVFVLEKGIEPPPSLLAAAVLSTASLAQFRWCRRNPPPEGTLFARLDGRDFTAIALLLSGLAGIYFLLTMLIDLLATMFLSDPLNTIKCGRSVLINSASMVMLLIAGRRRNLELVWVAVSLGLVGGIKVFLVDLFGASGLPLVLSVMSFGLVALAGSIVMSRWSARGADQPA